MIDDANKRERIQCAALYPRFFDDRRQDNKRWLSPPTRTGTAAIERVGKLNKVNIPHALINRTVQPSPVSESYPSFGM